MRTLAICLLVMTSCRDTDDKPIDTHTDDTSGALDADGDGFSNDQDCDDTNAGLSPSDLDGDGQSSCDGDCDDTDPLKHALDLDSDGNTICDGDCDDSNAALNPNAIEICDNVMFCRELT